MKLAARFTAAFALTLQLYGCASMVGVGSSEYGCKGMPEGVTCKSAREVYDLTEADDFRTVIENQEPDSKGHDGEHKPAKKQLADASPREVPGESLVVPEPARDPLPIRTQATVMRIWVAPWESTDGDLNVPGYVYTEIEPRRWELGITAPKSQPTLKPLQVSTASRSPGPDAQGNSTELPPGLRGKPSDVRDPARNSPNRSSNHLH